MDRFVIITGCSGGGKSTLLLGLAGRGYSTVQEPGRRIVQEELDRQGNALPWVDPAAFARRALEVAMVDYLTAAQLEGIVFFDRGLIDAAAALQHATAEPAIETVARNYPHHRQAFVAPPWPEIYANDQERKHSFSQAMGEYERLLGAYKQLGYDLISLPKVSVPERVKFVLAALNN